MDLVASVAPRCDHHPACAGCPLLSSPYSKTLEEKRARLREVLEARSLFEGEVVALAAQPSTGWRARARHVVNPQATRPDEVLNFYAQGSRELVPISTCQAHVPALEDALLIALRALIASPKLLEATAYLEGRSLDGHHTILTFCTRGEQDRDALLETLEAMRDAHFSSDEAHPVTLALRVEGHGAAIGSGELRALAPAALEEHLLLENGRRLTLSPGAFSQQHIPQLLAAHRLMRAWLDEPPERLIDLYCGAGAHGLALVAPGGAMIGIDVDAAAIESARRNINENEDIDGELLASADADAWRWLDERARGDEVVVVNPARAGLHWSAVRWLGERQPRELLYMSCNVETLARDLVRLARVGLRVDRAAMIDMMPHTEHLEALVRLSPGARRVEGEERAPWQGSHAYGADRGARRFGEGISGASAEGEQSVWWAVVAGKPPKRGEPPHIKEGWSRIVCERVHAGEHWSVVRIEASDLEGDEELRQRMRAWRHPILGDPTYGDRRVNYAASRHMQLDRMLLHCAQVGDGAVMPLDADWPSEALRHVPDEPRR